MTMMSGNKFELNFYGENFFLNFEFISKILGFKIQKNSQTSKPHRNLNLACRQRKKKELHRREKFPILPTNSFFCIRRCFHFLIQHETLLLLPTYTKAR